MCGNCENWHHHSLSVQIPFPGESVDRTDRDITSFCISITFPSPCSHQWTQHWVLDQNLYSNLNNQKSVRLRDALNSPCYSTSPHHHLARHLLVRGLLPLSSGDSLVTSVSGTASHGWLLSLPPSPDCPWQLHPLRVCPQPREPAEMGPHAEGR